MLSQASADGSTYDGSPGIARQREDIVALAERRGDDLVEMYVDDGVSAWDRRKRRPAYTRMLDDIVAGRIDTVLVWDLDRLHRQPAELERFITIADERQIALANVAGDVDLDTSDGRLMARIMAAVAAKSSDDTSRRIKRAMQAAAAEGKYGSGRGFGYRAGGKIDLAEAAMIRDMAARVLAGQTCAEVGRHLDRLGVPSVHGRLGVWSTQAVRRVLTSPRIAGLRPYDGRLVDGQWDAILDRDTWDAVRDTIERRRPPRKPPALLSRLLACSRCRWTLRVSGRGRGWRVYRCEPYRGSSHCGRTVIHTSVAERAATEQILRLYTRRPDLAPPTLAGLTGDELSGAWDDAPAGCRHDTIASLLGGHQILIMPATRRGPVYDPDRLAWPVTLS